MGVPGALAPTQAAEVSLAQKGEQLEAAIREAHSFLDSMQATIMEDAKDAAVPPPGAHTSLNRCGDEMQRLNSRLRDLVASVGQI